MARTRTERRTASQPVKPDQRGVFLWRVATETRRFSADDLSGGGAAVDPGRWNRLGDALLYTATSVALATLETAAHIDPAGLPLNKFLVRISVPNKVWQRRETLDVSKLGPAWNAVPSGLVSETAGAEWLESGRSALLLVPSVIAPEESCMLVSPGHPDAKLLRARVVRPLEYERLFRRRL